MGEHLRPMQLRLSDDPALIPELRQHFERSGFVTNRVSEDRIEAWRPDAPTAEQERREIELHLAVWRAMHAGIATELIDLEHRRPAQESKRPLAAFRLIRDNSRHPAFFVSAVIIGATAKGRGSWRSRTRTRPGA
jgi:hypothetical protein